MYRRTLALLWGGFGTCLILAIIDAGVGFMGHFQGLFIGGMAMFFMGAILRIGIRELKDTALANRGKSEKLQGDVDELRAELGETKNWAEAAARISSERYRSEMGADRDEDQVTRPPATIYQFPIRRNGQDAIYGSRSPEPGEDAEIWQLLDAEEPGRGHAGAS